MMNFDLQKLDQCLLICPEEFKQKVLEELSETKRILDVRFMSLEEFQRKKLFDYDLRAIKYLKEEFGFSIPNAREILANLHHVEDRHYGNEKLDRLVLCRKKLDEQGLLIYDPLFEKLLRNRRIIVAGYGKLSREDEELVGGEVVSFEWKEKNYAIASYEDIEEEVTGLYESIKDLIYRQDVDINRIFVMNATEDYMSYFKRFNEYYPFCIETSDDDLLIGSRMGKDFLSMIDTMSKKEIFEALSGIDDEVSAKLIAILNRYPDYDLTDVKDFIEEDLKHTKIADRKYKDIVHCVPLYRQFRDDEHVFLIGFNDGFPVFRKDTGYITDSIAPRVGVSLTEEKNGTIRENVRAYLSNIANLRISYAKRSPFREYEFSNLLEQKEYVIEEAALPGSVEKLQKTKLGYLLDRFYRYGSRKQELASLYLAYGDEGYRGYDNRFNGLRKDQIREKEKVILSYSSIDTFYKCSFAYYLRNILKIDSFDETFFTKAGTLCHNVLRDLFEEEEFDFERSWEKNLQDLYSQDKGFADEKESFFVSKMKEELKEDVAIILKQKKDTLLDKEICEKEFFVRLNAQVAFKGLIDKIMYRQLDDEVIVDVVDYKTGNTKIEEKLMPYGLSLQLPAYMYLLRKDSVFSKKISYGGAYLQHIINSEQKFDENKDRKQIKEESMKLDGFTTDDMERLFYCDRTLEEGSSAIIRGLRLKKDGTPDSRSKVVSDHQIDEKIAMVEDLIEKAGEAILSGRFDIDPKEIDGENKSCGYCPYRSICYRRNGDLRMISTKEKEESHGEEMD